VHTLPSYPCRILQNNVGQRCVCFSLFMKTRSTLVRDATSYNLFCFHSQNILQQQNTGKKMKKYQTVIDLPRVADNDENDCAGDRVKGSCWMEGRSDNDAGKCFFIILLIFCFLAFSLLFCLYIIFKINT